MVDDNESDIAPIIKKVLGGKLFEDEQGGLWKQNIIDAQGEILCGTSIHSYLDHRVCEQRTSGG
jgi:D-Tyr-tRNAtyr deacylase